MAVILMYYMNEELYRECEQECPVVTDTLEYMSHGGDTLIHLRLGDNHSSRLNNLLNHRFNQSIASEQFFIKKTRKHGKPKSIDRSAFEKKLKSLDRSRMTVEREIVKEYTYINTIGEHDTVQIVIKVRGDSMTAVIVFDTVEQCGAFVCPAWLDEMSERQPHTAQARLCAAIGQN